MYAYICMCVRKRRERKRVEGRSIIIYMAPPLAWVLPWQHNGRRPDNRVTVVMNTPGNCWCQCSKVSPKVPLGWSKRSYTNAHTHARSARAGQLFGIWEVFDLINNERGDDGKWKKELQRVSERGRLEGNGEWLKMRETESDGEPSHESCFQYIAVTMELYRPIFPKSFSAVRLSAPLWTDGLRSAQDVFVIQLIFTVTRGKWILK